MSVKNTLTNKQQETLEYIESYTSRNGHSPLVKEMQDHFGLKSLRSVTQRLDALQKKGLIGRDRFKHRSITVINQNHLSQNESYVQVPVIASVGCDTMEVYAQEQYGEYITMDKRLLKHHRDVIAVRASGNSMQDAGVLNGDYVLVEQTENVSNGDYVVAIVGDMAVLKRLERKDGMTILHPEAKGYSPIILNEDFKVFGKMVRKIHIGYRDHEDDIQIVPL